MKLLYATEAVRDLCTRAAVARKVYGVEAQKRLARRVKELETADRFQDLFAGPGRWHGLQGNRKGTWAGDVSGALRIIVTPKDDGTVVVVLEVTDYHR